MRGIGKLRILLIPVVCLLAFGSICTLQQVPPAWVNGSSPLASYLAALSPSPPPKPFPTSLQTSNCGTDFFWQQIALAFFNLLTGGSNWINHSGWPDFFGTASAVFEPPAKNCTRTINGLTVHGLPTYCCWFGVFCCLSPECGEHNELLIDACNCTVGAVTGLSLPHNNLVGSLDGYYFDNSSQTAINISVVQILSLLSCNLRGLGLQNNQLSGGLPESLTMLSQLRTLNLGYNQLNGTLPSTLGNMTAFNVLELTNNEFSGPIPRDLCSPRGTSPLTDLFLGNNQLTGALDIQNCRNLILVDATNNNLSGSLPNISGFPLLHIVHLSGNSFYGSITGTFDTLLFSGILVTDLNLARNSLTGSVPESLADLIYLTSLNLQTNNLTGTIPADLFAFLGTMTQLDASNNRLSGTIPLSIGQASSLISLDLSNNSLHGPIPDGLVAAMGAPSTIVDMRQTNVSCCGVGFVPTTGRYEWYNYSLPLLPKGLAMSTTLRSVSSADPEHLQGLSCPYLYNQAAGDAPDNLLVSWLLDPQYYMYSNCVCSKGFVFTNLSRHGEPNVTCKLPTQPATTAPWWEGMPYIWVIITLVPALFFLLLTWCCIFRRGSRPVILQNLLDMRKRLRGPPLSGDKVSIVVTDIEGFSNLMGKAPQLTTDALMLHNTLIRKTKWVNFGFTIEQEGDSYSVAFHEAVDAVKFCLQAQQLLAKQAWPEGLFKRKEMSQPSSKGMGSAKLKRAGTMIMSGIMSGMQWIGRSTDTPIQETSGSKPSELHSQCNKSLKDMYPASELSSRHSATHLGPSQLEMGLGPGEVEVMPSPRHNASYTAGQSALLHGRGQDPQLSAAGEAARRESLEGVSSARSGKALDDQQKVSSYKTLEEQHKAFFAHGEYGTTRSLPIGRNNSQLDGMRVRMGIATGTLPLRTAAAASWVMESAKVISDAAAGGQVLMCSSTFKEVQHMCEELGCVDHNGTSLSRLNAQRAPWWILGGRKREEKQEAVVLDMGHYVLCPRGPGTVPLLLSPQYLGQGRRKTAAPEPPLAPPGAPAGPGPGPVPSGRTTTLPPRAAAVILDLASIYRDDPSQDFEESPVQRMELYQVLAPSLVARGRVFGSKLGLKEDWVALDVPYFNAPGAAYAPLNSCDIAVAGLELPQVSVVFCMVDNGKQYASRHRRDAQVVHQELKAVVCSVLRQIPGGYFVKEQDGELKFMLAFRHPAAALMWCLAVQECSMYVDWPTSALRQWPEESTAQQLLFRGPRLKMGVCDGAPRSILPDYQGRADYCGYGVNQAARFMDAAAHGGQIACEESLFHQAVGCWHQSELDMFKCFACDSWAASGSTRATEQIMDGSTPNQRSYGQQPGSATRLVPSALSLPVPSARLQSAAMHLQPQEERKYDPSRLGPGGGAWPGPAAPGAGTWPGPGSHPVAQSSVNGFSQLETWMEQDEGADPCSSHLPTLAARPSRPVEDDAVLSPLEDPSCSRPPPSPVTPPAPPAPAMSMPPPGAEHAVYNDPVLRVSTARSALCLGAGTGPAAVTGRQTEVLALRLGVFRFKGALQPSAIVTVSSAALAGRRFAPDPPRGKGSRISEASGVLAHASMPALTVVDRYRKHFELVCRLRASTPECSRSVVSPRSERSERSVRPLIQRSWASLRAKSQSFLPRSATGSVKSGDRSPSSPGGARFGDASLRDV